MTNTTTRAASIRQIAASQTELGEQYRAHVKAVEALIFERNVRGLRADVNHVTEALCAASALLSMEAMRHERNAASSMELAVLVEMGAV